MRPGVIAMYERLYLSAFGLGLIGSALGWNAQAARLAADPMLAQMPWIMSVMTVAGIAVSLLLWYFTARMPGVVAKWIVVVFAGFAAIGLIFNLFALVQGVAPAASTVAIVGKALYIAAAVLLFRPEARSWFGEGHDEGETQA